MNAYRRRCTRCPGPDPATARRQSGFVSSGRLARLHAGSSARLLRLLGFFLAAVLVLTGMAGTASAAPGPASENRVKGLNAALATGVGDNGGIGAGQCWGEGVPQLRLAEGRGVHTYYVMPSSAEGGTTGPAVLVHNTSCPIGAQSISGRMRAAGPGEEFGFPGQGRIRYVPPRGYNPAEPLPRGPQGGYLDRFGNEWTVGPSRTPGEPFEWDVQLSRRGRGQIGWLSRDGSHVNVSPRGRVTH